MVAPSGRRRGVGTTASSIWVRLDGADGDEVAAQRVAQAFGAASLVAPPQNGWVTVFPAEPTYGDPGPARRLSSALGSTCADFFCFDSDVAQATLIVEGADLDVLFISPPGLREELREMGDSPPEGPPVPGITVGWEVTGALERWTTALGRSTPAELVAAINGEPSTPFAEEIAAAALEGFGIGSDRLTMDYRFFEYEPDRAAGFLRGGS